MTINEQHDNSCIEINPSQEARISIIWLHGLGADGTDFVPIVSELHLPASLNARFIFPHAPIIPVTLNQGYEMRAWFDIYDLTIHTKVDALGITNSCNRLKSLIEKEERKGIPSRSIILAGFSQGAVIALLTGLSHEKPLGGIIVLSSFLPSPQDVVRNASQANRTIPVFIAHGTEDGIIPYALGKATYVALTEAGYPTTWHCYPMSHSVCAEEIKDISRWIQSIKYE